MIYPIILAKQPLSYSLRTVAVPTFVSSLEYPVNSGVVSAIQADLDGNAEPNDYEFIQVATEDILNPISDTFLKHPAQRIDYGPSPANIAFHIWVKLADSHHLEVQFQMGKGNVVVLPSDVIGTYGSPIEAGLVDRMQSGALGNGDDFVTDYEYGEELDLESDSVPQDIPNTAFRPLIQVGLPYDPHKDISKFSATDISRPSKSPWGGFTTRK